MNRYTVTLRFEAPAWDEKNGIPYEIEAASKSEAVKKARRHAEEYGHTGTGKGRYTFKAIETEH